MTCKFSCTCQAQKAQQQTFHKNPHVTSNANEHLNKTIEHLNASLCNCSLDYFSSVPCGCLVSRSESRRLLRTALQQKHRFKLTPIIHTHPVSTDYNYFISSASMFKDIVRQHFFTCTARNCNRIKMLFDLHTLRRSQFLTID